MILVRCNRYGIYSGMQGNVQFIGVAGTAGSGKDTVAQLMAELFGSENLSTGDMVRSIARQVYRLAPHVRPTHDQSYTVASYMRKEISPTAIIKLCMLEGEVQHTKTAIIHGLRTMGEADAVRKAGGIIVGVDADVRLRYDRLKKDRDMLKTFEEFLEQDELENSGLSDKGDARGIRHIIDSADVVLTNEGSIDDLTALIKEKVSPLLKK